MNITVYLGASEGNDPALRKAVQALGTWIGTSGYNITLVKNMIFVRNTMYDFIIHRNTDRCRISVIIQEVGNTAVGTDQLLTQIVDIQSGYTGVHCLLHLAEYIRQNFT